MDGGGKTVEKEQVKEIAVNVHGWCLDEPFPNHEPFELITARATKTSVNMKGLLAKHTDEVLRGEFFRVVDSDFEFSEQERAEPEGDAYRRYRVIGYMFPLLPDNITGRCPPWQKQAGAKGTQKPAAENLLEWKNFDDQPQSPPVIVVSPVFDEPPSVVQYFGLVKPKDGVCETVIVTSAEVFFRYEYRDGSTSKKGRDKAWPAKVARACGTSGLPLLLSRDQTLRLRPKKFGGSSGKLTVRPELSLMNELRVDVAALRISPEEHIRNRIVKTLQRLESDLEFAPLMTNAGLHGFIQATEFDEESAQNAVEDARGLWGPIEGMDTRTLQKLRSCLVAADPDHFDYRDLYALFAQGCFEIKQAEANGEEIDEKELGCRVLGIAHRCTPPTLESPSAILAENEKELVVFVEALLARLQDMLKGWDVYGNTMADACGSQVTDDGDPLAIWARYGDARDTDSARVAMQEIGRALARATHRGMTEGIIEPLRVCVGLLESVLKEVRKAAAAKDDE